MEAWRLEGDVAAAGYCHELGAPGQQRSFAGAEQLLGALAARTPGQAVTVVCGPSAAALALHVHGASVTLVSGCATVDVALRRQLLTRLSHDIRGPVGTVWGALQELQLGLVAPTPEDQTLFQLADRGLRRLTRLAANLATVALLEDAKLELAMRPSELGALAREACDDALAIEARRNVKLTLVSTAPCPIHADPEHLLTALGAVVANALRHARSRVVVTLHPELSELSIADDGTGLTDDARARLFSRLEPGEGRAASNLGLSIAHDLVRTHGGRLRLADSGPAGTCFVVELPRLAHEGVAPSL
jgi:signal transduction histidine kinase